MANFLLFSWYLLSVGLFYKMLSGDDIKYSEMAIAFTMCVVLTRLNQLEKKK